MNVRARILPLLALTALGAACVGNEPPPVAPPPPPPQPTVMPTLVVTAEPPRETPDAPFRDKAPEPAGKIDFVAPKIAQTTLKNGLRVLIVERHELPIVGVRLVVNAGAGDVADARPGLLSFLGGMLEQGTKKRDALKISDDFEALGAQHGAWFDWDAGGMSMKVTADKLEAALEIMSDVALHPTFPDAEVERLRARRIASIQAEKSSPGAISQNAIAAAIYGRQHPYGHSISGEEVDAKKLTRAELTKTYDRLFTPQTSALVIAGDVTEAAILPRLEATFGTWKKGAKASHAGPTTPAKVAAGKRVVIVDKPGAQSQIQLVRPGVKYSTKDRDAIVVMNAILGGMFSSRVNLNLREKNAYTYGARSYFAMRHGAGPFSVGASVIADKTIPALKEVFAEVEGLRTRGPTDEEMALAKESIRQAMPARFESISEVATAVADLVVYDLPLDEYEKRPARIDAITAADVKRVAEEQLKLDQMTVVIVGDKAKLAPDVESLGLGTYEERDFFGNPVGTAATGAGGAAAKGATPPAPTSPAAPKKK